MVDLIVLSDPGRKLFIHHRTDFLAVGFGIGIGETVFRESGIEIEVVFIDTVGSIDIEADT